MSVLINNNGTLDPIAGNGIKNTFTGTTAEVNAAMQAGLIAEGTVVYITDDNGVGESAEDVSYDNTESELTATNVQDAIDEVNTSLTELQGELLWTNQNPTSSFASQTILDSSISDYDYLDVSFLGNANGVGTAQITHWQIYISDKVSVAYKVGGYNSVAQTWNRNFSITSSGLNFGNCSMTQSGTGTETQNTSLIPYQVRGFKIS